MNATKCLFPCNFMEYKVSMDSEYTVFMPIYKWIYYICPFPQTVEDPLSRPLPENASSTLLPMFTSRTVQILKEVEAFPFPSLVADCGGVLGLFIGFNFLMVVEWIVWCTQIILTKFNTNKK